MGVMVGLPLADTQLLDICEYLGNETNLLNIKRLYLDPKLYHCPPQEGESIQDNAHFELLKNALFTAAHNAGSPLVSNGGQKDCRQFHCRILDRKYQERPGRKKKADPFREDYMIDSATRGKREDGRSKSRRTRTTKSLPDAPHVCHFGFRIKWDSLGFYIPIATHSGCPNHVNHLSDGLDRLTLPLKLIPEREKETLQDMCQAAIGNAVSRNYIFSKTGKFITKAQLAYFNSPPPMPLVDGLKSSDTDEMLSFFEQSEDISYHVLWDVPIPPTEPPSPRKTALVSSLCPAGEDGSMEIDHSDDSDFQPARDMAASTRTNGRVHPNSRVFLGCGYCTTGGARDFALFPEVVWADVTSDTNNTGNFLLTFSCRTSEGKQVIFLKVWIPNQNQFSFRWVFKFVLKSLIPETTLTRVRVFMVDGDPQQRNELVKAMMEFMANAIVQSCAWHILNQGMKRRLPSKNLIPAGDKHDQYGIFVGHVKSWCYSWMTPGGCESEQEYELSHQLLLAYINSREGLEACNGIQAYQKAISNFVVEYVQTKDNLFLFYKKMNRRYFNHKTSSAHEGTNLGLKQHAAAVKPSQRIQESAKNSCLQSLMKTCQQDASATYLSSSKPLWSDSPTACHIVSGAESILRRRVRQTEYLDLRRISHNQFEVFSKEPASDTTLSLDQESMFPPEKSPIPDFVRVRTVTMLSDGTLLCSCCEQEREGLCCAHTCKCVKHYFPTWNGPTHHEVSPRWWISWLKYAHRKEYPELTNAMEMLLSNEVKGPRLPEALPHLNSYDPPFASKSVRERLRNYTSQQLNRLLPQPIVTIEGNGTRTIQFIDGCIQETFTQEGTQDEDYLSFPNDDDDDNEMVGDTDPTFQASLEAVHKTIDEEARQLLKPSVDDLYHCLERLNSPKENRLARKMLDDYTNCLRLKIAESNPRKRNIENVQTVSVNVEERTNRVNRIYASRKC
jgi:MULE transposase domain